MAAVDPNRPGYYMDGTPIPSRADPAATNRVAAMQVGFGESQPQAQPVRKSGNPYNNPSQKPIYMTADNQIVNDPKGAFAYRGVPTMGLRTQFNAQNEFKIKMEQWAKEFAETQNQSLISNRFKWNDQDTYNNTNPITGEDLTGNSRATQVGVSNVYGKVGGTGSYYVNGVLQ